MTIAFNALGSNPIRHNLSQIYQAGERARDMVKQILAFSRKEHQEKSVIKITPILNEFFKNLMGIRAFVMKPIVMRDMAGTIRAVLDR